MSGPILQRAAGPGPGGVATEAAERTAGTCAGCVGELYRRLSDRLEEIVRMDLDAPQWVVEDACQVAWGRLVRHQQRVRRETVRAWLTKTALREARRLMLRQQRDLPLDEMCALDADAERRETCAGPEELVLRRARLDLIARLPVRQQRIIWLHALGMSYLEIALQTGCTTRTVERQLLRGRRTVRAAA